MLQTQLQEKEKENKSLMISLEEIRKEKEQEMELFNKKVEELQEKFLEVEEKVKLKNLKIDELQKKSQEYYKLKEVNEELKYALENKEVEVKEVSDHLGGAITDSETIYESLEFQESQVSKKPKTYCRQFSSCLRKSIVIIFGIAIVVSILVVLPLKMTLGS